MPEPGKIGSHTQGHLPVPHKTPILANTAQNRSDATRYLSLANNAAGDCQGLVRAAAATGATVTT